MPEQAPPTYLILDTEAEAITKSNTAWATNIIEKNVTKRLWAIDVGKDGRAALRIDAGTEKFLDQAEAVAVVADLPDGKGENWEKPASPIEATSDVAVEAIKR